MYEQKFTGLQGSILRLLFTRAGVSFTARGISIPLGVSQTAVSKALPELRKRGYVSVKKDNETKRLTIRLNRDNPTVIGLKRADNVKLVYESGLAQFLHESFPGATLVIFGSYSMGEDTVTSDIDIAVVGARKADPDMMEFEKTFERKISLHYFQSFGKIDRNLRNNILGGILLKGAIDI